MTERLGPAIPDELSGDWEIFRPSGSRCAPIHPRPGCRSSYRSIGERKRAEEDLDRSARRQEFVSQLGLRALAGEELGTVMDDAVALVARA